MQPDIQSLKSKNISVWIFIPRTFFDVVYHVGSEGERFAALEALMSAGTGVRVHVIVESCVLQENLCTDRTRVFTSHLMHKRKVILQSVIVP